jgi:hypothetical protein
MKSDCEELRIKGFAQCCCCESCHDHGRSDTELESLDYEGEIYLVCCHIKRDLLGITFKEALGIA